MSERNPAHAEQAEVINPEVNHERVTPERDAEPARQARFESLEPVTFHPGAGRRRRRLERLMVLLIPVLFLLVWEIVARLNLIDRRFFPAPTDISETVLSLIQSGELGIHVSASLGRAAIGYGLGTIPAILLGLAMGLSWPVRTIISPLIGFTYPIPKIALLPILLLIFGLGNTSLYVLVAITVFYIVLMNTVTGVLTIERVYLDVGRVFRASRLDFLRTIAIPGALPVLYAALRLAWGLALIVVIAAEFNTARDGLGSLIYRSWQVFSVERMYAGLLVTGLLGWLSYLIFDELERLLMPWNRDRKPR